MLDRVSSAFNRHATIVRELAESRERLLSFLHAVGHAIRTPFIGIDTTLQLLEIDAPRLSESELRARVAAASQSTRSACAFGLSMIGDLFELIRSDTGKWCASPSTVDIFALAHDVRAIVAPQAIPKSLEIVVRTEACTPQDLSAAWTDGHRLRQSLVNVVANSVKFSAEGLIEIELSMPSRDTVAIVVRDCGPGLDETSLEAIFEPFHQSERTAAQSGEGLGLGLAIAERCARLLGGHWTAANRTDRVGAEFTLRLPYRCPTDSDDTATAAAAHGSAAPLPESLRILVVDDAADSARLARHHLASLGHQASIATGIGEAEKSLASGRFDLVVADYELQDGTAEDLLQKVGDLPVIVSSAHAGAAERCARAAGIVPKPVTRAALAHAIGCVRAAFRTSATP
jgi:CheY-like chemotaxis protein/nitrogen-specific signal transduction histidine kinase